MNVPSRMARTSSVLVEHPNSSNNAPWHTWALSALLNLVSISPPMASSTCSFVTHSLVVPSLCGTLTLVGLGFLVCWSSWWSSAHTFFCTSFLLLPRPPVCLPLPLRIMMGGILLSSTGIRPLASSCSLYIVCIVRPDLLRSAALGCLFHTVGQTFLYSRNS